MEIAADCETRGVEYTIEEIVNALENDDETTLEKFYNNQQTASIKSGVNKNVIALQDVVISVKQYSKYKFLVGQTGEIEGVKIGEVTNTTSKTEFKTVESFERNELSLQCFVKYNSNGGNESISNIKVKVGDTIALPKNIFTKAGYQFAGWCTNSDGSGRIYEEETEVKIQEDMTFYAQWEEGLVYIMVLYL